MRLYEHGLGRNEKAMGDAGRGWIRFWVTGILLLAVSAGAPVPLTAQDDEQGGVTFAGGHMVRGTVTTVSGDRMTVKTESGEVYQVVVSANTKLTKDKQPVKASEIKAGDGVGAMGVLDAPTNTVHAIFVGILDAAQVRKAREDLGKAYILGRVTAIDMDALKLTVLRPDKVSQVIGVDEGTSFKRGGSQMEAMMSGSAEVRGGNKEDDSAGGESITLADVKVGDSIAGRGALKSGLFVPTELRVMDAAARERRRRRTGEDRVAPASAAAPAPIVPQ